ncbi:hypothetical protein H696_02839 [Fonticula alba]|uniref:DNA-directed RNA polymerases I and III subunit RPAC1 n=1 Tax=Fonticula alba TaxID=691883 RepID=A0A058Z9D0_FONAL|nr:hypothetical protein H696_02839 [Fonticula alba]KCV70498.1 hypothetical protein H696_02839 [Fonticula alba]|eukprot:XP_009495014.1 hypothetical protein H696_02839 [Fonticula alba]
MSSAVDRKKRFVELKSNRIEHPSSISFPPVGAYEHEDVFSIEKFQKTFKVQVIKLTDDHIEFDFVGIDAALANAIRRILLAEVPTMAIENVYVKNNTSVLHDELLCHRLGLIPIYADPRQFDFKFAEDEATDINTIVLSLNVKCTHNPSAPAGASDPNVRYINSTAFSRDIKWVPQGPQAERFAEDPIRPVHDAIEIIRLRPGQELDIDMHCVKGIGKIHAKWSPVSTAFYRIMPQIDILKPIPSELVDKFVDCFSPGVMTVSTDSKTGTKTVSVANARNDSMSREVMRHPEFADSVRISRVRDHFIFSVESVGMLPSAVLVQESIKVLREKAMRVKLELNQLITNSNGETGAGDADVSEAS